MKERKAQLKMRATEKEKVRIQNKAKKCGLSVSEYLRKRALGYSPKTLLPETFYEFTERLGNLYDALERMNSTELQEQVLQLIDDVYAKLLTLDKESEVETSGSPQSLLCGEKEQPLNNELFGTSAGNE